MEEKSIHYEKIARWIAAKIAGTITAEEEAELVTWLEENERHVAVYERVRARCTDNGEQNAEREMKDILEDMEKVKSRMSGMKTVAFIRRRFMRYAAAVVLILGIGAGMTWTLLRDGKTETVLAFQTDTIFPGTSKATLTLATGQRIALERTSNDSIRGDGALITSNNGELVYASSGEAEADEVRLNVLNIPRGGEYKLVLSDGTQVWLNADTELKYPATFAGDCRKVVLRGEAYFEVARDASHPFIVETADMDIRVLGTEFNVTSYPDDATASVTLAGGKVELSSERQTVVLHPSEQFSYDKASGEAAVCKVDVSQYTGWKDGLLIFDSMPLEELSLKLGRWYDVSFDFSVASLKSLRFTGTFKKNQDIGYILQIIEEITNVKCTIKGKTVNINTK